VKQDDADARDGALVRQHPDGAQPEHQQHAEQEEEEEEQKHGTDPPPPPPPPPGDPSDPPPAAGPPPPPLRASTFSSRELAHISQEDAGEVRALYVSNDGSPECGRALVGIKNIFAKCLPMMPKEYICKLLFERRHRSVVVVRGTDVIAGITYRPFSTQGFGEIAFCAVAQSLQVSGFGTRLMNWTKVNEKTTGVHRGLSR
jgi:hypothetical protein